jgi:hypothetical protein
LLLYGSAQRLGGFRGGVDGRDADTGHTGHDDSSLWLVRLLAFTALAANERTILEPLDDVNERKIEQTVTIRGIIWTSYI